MLAVVPQRVQAQLQLKVQPPPLQQYVTTFLLFYYFFSFFPPELITVDPDLGNDVKKSL